MDKSDYARKCTSCAGASSNTISFFSNAFEKSLKIVRINADEKTGNSQNAQNADNDGVNFAHVGVLVQIVNKFTPFFPMKRIRNSLLTLT